MATKIWTFSTGTKLTSSSDIKRRNLSPFREKKLKTRKPKKVK